jgi:hypothetical protein
MESDHWNDLRAFLRFVDEKLESSGESLTLDDALSLWDYETQGDKERQETIEAIGRGLKDVGEGRTRPIEDFDREFRKKRNFLSG